MTYLGLTPDMLLVKSGEKRPTIVHVRRRLQCDHSDCREHLELADACFAARQKAALVWGLTPAPVDVIPLCGAVRPASPEWSKAYKRPTVRVYVIANPVFAEGLLRRMEEHDEGRGFVCGRCMDILRKRRPMTIAERAQSRRDHREAREVLGMTRRAAR